MKIIHEMYNEELKNEYLKKYEDNGTQSQETIKYVFYKTRETEEQLKRDICDFTQDEIGEVLAEMQPLNTNISKSNGSFISGYISWAKGNGKSKTNIHPLQGVEKEWYAQFVDRNIKLYISEDDLYEMVFSATGLINAQDATILYLAFNGVSGHDLSELLNLQEEDINWDNGVLHLKDDRHEERELTLFEDLKEDTLRTLRQALNEKEYQNKNGQSKGRNKVSELVKNNYVIKTASRRSNSNGRADKHTVYRRISGACEYFELPYLTVKSIAKSGMLKMAKDLLLRDGILDTPQLSEIGDQFGIRKIHVNGYDYYNTPSLKEYINVKNIKQLYNIDIYM